MSATWLNLGIDWKANLVLNKVGPQNFTVRLFTNSPALGPTLTIGSFTECALSGYAPVTCIPADWTGSTAAGLATYNHPAITFTFDPYAGGISIVGYHVTIPGLIAVLADNLPSPYLVPPGGGSMTVTPTYNDRGY